MNSSNLCTCSSLMFLRLWSNILRFKIEKNSIEEQRGRNLQIPVWIWYFLLFWNLVFYIFSLFLAWFTFAFFQLFMTDWVHFPNFLWKLSVFMLINSMLMSICEESILYCRKKSKLLRQNSTANSSRIIFQFFQSSKLKNHLIF